VITLVIVVIDEGFDLHFKITGQEVIFQQNAAFQGLLPTLDLALRLRMICARSWIRCRPTLKGVGRIEREFEASDQRRYFVTCPHCGARQWLKFERLRWKKGQPETAACNCEACEQPISYAGKTVEYRKPDAPTADVDGISPVDTITVLQLHAFLAAISAWIALSPVGKQIRQDRFELRDGRVGANRVWAIPAKHGRLVANARIPDLGYVRDDGVH